MHTCIMIVNSAYRCRYTYGLRCQVCVGTPWCRAYEYILQLSAYDLSIRTVEDSLYIRDVIWDVGCLCLSILILSIVLFASKPSKRTFQSVLHRVLSLCAHIWATKVWAKLCRLGYIHYVHCRHCRYGKINNTMLYRPVMSERRE